MIMPVYLVIDCAINWNYVLAYLCGIITMLLGIIFFE